MDLILPGHSMTEDTLENVWAFVDSSGSISDNELNQFLTQLYRIAKSFKCVVNICYWDTEVTDVYKNITREKDVLKCIPHNRGGTDINCVYSWIRSHNIKPSVLLILTDGYFGDIIDFSHVKRYKNNTIMVLSSDICVTENMKKIGKIIRL